jgi:AcrR family transcriptional regulator
MTSSPDIQWRDRRRSSARQAILEAAWELAHAEGLLGWSLRDLAKQAGITPPTVYAYFASKNAIYDAMFGRAAEQFDDFMGQPYDSDDPRECFTEYGRRFIAFCTSDVVRYQLLFQRTIPHFEPSPESYAPSIRALERLDAVLVKNGVTAAHHHDLWTAVATGLVSQQIANDPGGTRWSSLTEEAVDMLLTHCLPANDPPSTATRPRRRRGTTT